MKTIFETKILIATLPALLALTACGGFVAKPLMGQADSSSLGEQTVYVAGNGAGVAGTGASSVPNSNGAVARIVNGLQGNVSPGAGNFSKMIPQVATNLPRTTDPTLAGGYDQIQLLAYAACSDLTTGSTPLMKSKYSVDPNATISASQTALVNAGVKMLDQYAGGVASQGPNSTQISSVFSNLVTQIQGQSGSTTKIAFMSVCIAANSTGSTMLGF